MANSRSRISNFTKILGLLMVLPMMTSLITVNYQEAFAATDPDVDCLAGKTLVYRLFHKDYVCVDHSTAARWVNLNVATIVQGPESLERTVLEAQKEAGLQCKSGMVPMTYQDLSLIHI